jgi:uncharacterized membrane protein YqiK
MGRYYMVSNGFFEAFPVVFMIFFAIILVIIFISVISNINNYRKNASSPILTQKAKVVSKRSEVFHHTSTTNNMPTSSTRYYATFETEAGQRFELVMSGMEYGLIAEGDCGEVTFQGEWFKKFNRQL